MKVGILIINNSLFLLFFKKKNSIKDIFIFCL